ncbi:MULTISPECIES: hypothetical protein [Cyanophyceae]|uniref:hypothetical protein n=1 Tax=Cyanophyceae TaxID=3028117 RepID=UPI001686FE67|nr:hypothetical protein [Trichocoleus sp. FACHB-40]MBD2002152.1 hypothetical protein [Trichocoleus sp. FACHB-40]
MRSRFYKRQRGRGTEGDRILDVGALAFLTGDRVFISSRDAEGQRAIAFSM